MPATFFPVASALIERRLLDVNKIQCVLASVDDPDRLVREIDAEVEAASRNGDCLPPSTYRATWWKASRWDPPAVVYVKRLLQDALPDAVRVPLVDDLFRTIVSIDERRLADDLYMDVDDLRAMKAADPDVDDPRREPRAVVGRDRNPARGDFGQVGLGEPDGERSTHNAQYKHRRIHETRPRACADLSVST